MAKPSHADVWAALEAELNAPEAPPDALTLAQFAERFRLPVTTAVYRLKRMETEGKVKRLHARVRNARGHHYETDVWVPV